MKFAHFCLLLLLLRDTIIIKTKILKTDGVATEIFEATSQLYANQD